MNTVDFVMNCIQDLDMMTELYQNSIRRLFELQDQLKEKTVELVEQEKRLQISRDELLITGQVPGSNAEIRAANLRNMTSEDQDQVNATTMELELIKAEISNRNRDIKFGEMFIESSRVKVNAGIAMLPFDEDVKYNLRNYELAPKDGKVSTREMLEFMKRVMNHLGNPKESDNGVDPA